MDTLGKIGQGVVTGGVSGLAQTGLGMLMGGGGQSNPQGKPSQGGFSIMPQSQGPNIPTHVPAIGATSPGGGFAPASGQLQNILSVLLKRGEG